jgi:hypothetical protein
MTVQNKLDLQALVALAVQRRFATITVCWSFDELHAIGQWAKQCGNVLLGDIVRVACAHEQAHQRAVWELTGRTW